MYIMYNENTELTILLGKLGSSKKMGRPNIRQIVSVKEAAAVSLQDLSRTYWKRQHRQYS